MLHCVATAAPLFLHTAMRTSLQRLLFPVLLALSSWAWGQTSAPLSAASASPMPSDQEVLHQELREIKAKMQTAMNERNLEGLLSQVTEDVVFTTMNGDRVVGKAGIRQYFDKMLNGAGAPVKSIVTAFEAEELSHLYGTQTAVAFGHSNDRYLLANGDEIVVTPRWTSTLVKREGRWLVASFDYSANMFDNPVLHGQRKVLAGMAALAAAVAAVIGFLIGRRWKKP